MSIYPYKRDGKHTGRWRVEIQVNGRRCRGTFATLEEAREAEANWVKGLPEWSIVRDQRDSKPTTLKDLYQETGGVLWRGKAYRETAEKRLWRVIEILKPNTKLAELTTVMLDTVVNTLVNEGLKGSTVNKYLSNFHKLMEWGRPRYGIVLPEFPREDEDDGRIRWLTQTEERTLFSLVPEDVGRMIRVAILTGMRRGEFYSIKRQDLERGWLHIWETKTKESRSIPIGLGTEQDLLWLFERGMPNEDRLRYRWDLAREKMSLSNDPWFTFHVARHTCATRLVQANVHLRTIQKWLGHKSIQTTLRYAQVSEGVLEQALTTLENYFGAETPLEKHSGGAVDISPRIGYTPETTVSGLSWYNSQSVTVNFRYGQNDGNVRGRGEIGRHAGFRFQWGTKSDQDDNK